MHGAQRQCSLVFIYIYIYIYRRLGGEIAVERSPPAGKSSFEFVLVPCVRARRSCEGGREEFTLLSLGVRQHKCCAPGACQAVARIVPSVARRCPVGCAPLSRRLRALSRGLRAVVPSVSRREIDGEVASEIDSEFDWEIDSEIDCETDGEIASEIDSEIDGEIHWEIDSEIDCEIDGEIDFESISYSR